MESKKVCSDCLLGNLTESVGVIKCQTCRSIFCVHFASATDPQFCTECFGDITVTKEVVTKEYSHYNEEEDTITTYKRRARAIKLEGTDWLFAQRKIETISDAELELAIEYHKAIAILMINERAVRTNKKMHRYAGIKISVSRPESVTTTTTTKTVKELKGSKVSATSQAIIENMLKQGKSQADLMEMLKQIQASLTGKP